MNKIKHFFWLCSGSNIKFLEKCPSEGSKYAGIGATIFFTGVFAAISGGYALFTVFDSYLLAIIFGTVWGLMIFNLDRFIVSSMRKTGKRSDTYMAIPRIALAVLISIVIAKPLELKVFDKEINSELILMQQEDKALQEANVKSRFIDQKNVLAGKIQTLKNEIDKKAAKRDELMEVARREADGTGGTGKRNPGPVYKIKKAEADRVQEEFEELVAQNNSEISQLQSQLDGALMNEDQDIAQLEESDLSGLASRIEAMDRLTEKSTAIWVSHLFIILLFIVIETAPVFVKLMSPYGPYDQLMFVHEYKFKAGKYQALAKINSTIKESSKELQEEENKYVLNKLRIGLEKT